MDGAGISRLHPKGINPTYLVRNAQAADAVAVEPAQSAEQHAQNDGEEQGGSEALELEQVDCSGQDEQGVGEDGLVEGSDEEEVEAGDDRDEEEEQSDSKQEEQARRATGENRSAPTSPRHSGRPTQRPKFHGE